MDRNNWTRSTVIVGIAALGFTAAVGSQFGTPAAARPAAPTTVFLPPSVAPGSGRIDYRDFDAQIAAVMARPGMVGMSIAVVEDGRIAFARGYGTTQLGSGDPVTARTVFRWASLSKGVAATMVGELAAEGKVSLSAPISLYNTTLRLPGGSGPVPVNPTGPSRADPGRTELRPRE